MRLTDENGVPTMAGATLMFRAADEARANAGWHQLQRERRSRIPPVTFADCLPWLRASVEWARARQDLAQGLAVEDAAFARDAPYKEPADREHMRGVFEIMRQSRELPGETRRFYAFLEACLKLAMTEK